MGRKKAGNGPLAAQLKAVAKRLAAERAHVNSGRPAKPQPIKAPPPGAVSPDAELMAKAFVDVKKLERPARERVRPPVRRSENPFRRHLTETEAALAELDAFVGGAGPFRLDDTTEAVSGLADGIDARLLRQLKRGDYALEAHLDLHGLTKEEAKEALVGFMRASLAASRRCVLIVHGRGLRSKDQVPVLKEAVVAWLTRGGLSAHVLAFATARPSDGGAGALYVLLRRKR